eukprot:6211380-Pleurochrysis_carterae.AAC.1
MLLPVSFVVQELARAKHALAHARTATRRRRTLRTHQGCACKMIDGSMECLQVCAHSLARRRRARLRPHGNGSARERAGATRALQPSHVREHACVRARGRVQTYVQASG